MILLPASRRIFAATEPVDMRRSFDVLHEIAREQLGLDAMRSAVVLFFNRPRTHCKALFHDGSGFVILYSASTNARSACPSPLRLQIVLSPSRSTKSPSCSKDVD